jgi:hypothetical protein
MTDHPTPEDLAAAWYLARDGKIVWQGTRAELEVAIAKEGVLSGDEAAWSGGMDAWEPIRDGPSIEWIRDAQERRDQRTGVSLEYSMPSGTQSLALPDSAILEVRALRPRREREAVAFADRREDTDKPRGAPSRRWDDDFEVPQKRRLLPAVLVGLAIGGVVAFLVVVKPELLGLEVVHSVPANPPATRTTSPAAAPTTATPPAAADAGTAPLANPPEAQPAADSPVTEPSIPAPKATTSSPPANIRNTDVDTPPRRSPDPRPSAGPAAGIRIMRTAKPAVGALAAPLETGTLEQRQAEIQRSMNGRMPRWQACVRTAQEQYPALRGRILFTVSVDATGRVNGVSGAQGNKGAQFAAGCMLGELKRLKFAAGDAVRVPVTVLAR